MPQELAGAWEALLEGVGYLSQQPPAFEQVVQHIEILVVCLCRSEHFRRKARAGVGDLDPEKLALVIEIEHEVVPQLLLDDLLGHGRAWRDGILHLDVGHVDRLVVRDTH